MPDQHNLPEERFLVLNAQRFDLRFDFFLCPIHGLIAPTKFDSDWNTDCGCPVSTYREEPCDEALRPVFLDSVFSALRKQGAEQERERLKPVIDAARSWLIREHGDNRPNHPADEAAARLYDAFAALDSEDSDAG